MTQSENRAICRGLIHEVEGAMGIASMPEWAWTPSLQAYNVWYPSEFGNNKLSVIYYSDERISYGWGSEDINITNIDDWYLTTMRHHFHTVYQRKK